MALAVDIQFDQYRALRSNPEAGSGVAVSISCLTK